MVKSSMSLKNKKYLNEWPTHGLSEPATTIGKFSLEKAKALRKILRAFS
jgi:hypothetical protein